MQHRSSELSPTYMDRSYMMYANLNMNCRGPVNLGLKILCFFCHRTPLPDPASRAGNKWLGSSQARELHSGQAKCFDPPPPPKPEQNVPREPTYAVFLFQWGRFALGENCCIYGPGWAQARCSAVPTAQSLLMGWIGRELNNLALPCLPPTSPSRFWIAVCSEEFHQCF